VVVASKNPDKIAEVEAVLASLDPPIEVITGHNWDDIDEVGTTLVANALLKAHAVVAATGHAAIADDTGLEVEALYGAPGVRTARYAGENATYHENVTQLLFDMAGVEDRSAKFCTVVALVLPSGDELVVEGILEGEITTERRGDGGFGYDPVFDVGRRTLAEMPPEEKNTISHRALALQELAAALTP
jgi:XTP/dITP diphosphohydrolase